ncbi:hypothetical protein [Marinomonas spartinae]|nr:hypothetical protein [Marinomonas spartinae]MBJ7556565.1 hypothetical protein [Marinomonas spartinae]
MKKKGIVGSIVAAVVTVALGFYTPLPSVAIAPIANWLGDQSQDLVD